MVRLAYSFISLVVAAATLSPISAEAAPPSAPVLRPPVDAPVFDPFRAPSTAFGPGNRGIEYDTRAGQPVSAAESGVVVFAGPVGGQLHITIDHGGGLLSSYSFVSRIFVRRGESIEAGEVIAAAADTFHFGVRHHGAYVDPMSLIGRRVVEVRLVGHQDERIGAAAAAAVDRGERQRFRELTQLRAPRPTILPAILGSPLSTLDAMAGVDALVRGLDALADMSRSAAALAHDVVALELPRQGPCTPSGVSVEPPAQRRIAVVADGLGSSGTRPGAISGLDLSAHGYATDDVLRFDYTGGSVESDPGGSAYSEHDTFLDIEVAVGHFAELIIDIARLHPGVPIDVYGHSLGGLVIRLALAQLAAAGVDIPVEVAVTISSPHGGVPLADAAAAVGDLELVDGLIDLLGPGTWLDHVLEADVIDDLIVDAWSGVAPFPPGVHAVAIGTRWDLVVPGTRAGAPGARHVIVGGSIVGAHGEAPSAPGVAREVSLALAGMDPACRSIGSRLLDVVPVVIGEVEDGVAAALVVASSVAGPGPLDRHAPHQTARPGSTHAGARAAEALRCPCPLAPSTKDLALHDRNPDSPHPSSGPSNRVP